MKRIRMNKYLAIGLGLFVTVMLFLIGKGDEVTGAVLATIPVISLTEVEKSGFSETEQKVILACKKLAEQMKSDVNTGKISREELAGLVAGIKMEVKGDASKTLKEKLEDLQEMAKKQGTTLTELKLKMNGVESGNKSIAEVLKENEDELKRVFLAGSGVKYFMINQNHKGEFVARPFDPTVKAPAVHATIGGIDGGASSIAQSINAATILRMGGDASIQSQYRNTPWVFDLCNLQNVGFDMPFALWYEEQAKQGASANVAEGGSKPLSQYAYTLKSAEYKKEATLLGFTQEFQIDFERLQGDILNKGKIDLVNRINTAILANIITAGTAYNTSASFGTRAANAVNDWVALAAMAAQVDSATFGANANAAIMSTFKKYNIGTQQTSQLAWIDTPGVLSSLALIGNPAMGADDVLVGDFKQYNILLRGGLIVKVGYNGTDFAENRFSTVLEQFYFDYISTLRTPAIVKGTTFATVKAAITTP
jgi:CII-binding regulator of phage lambda lysogenization HflD